MAPTSLPLPTSPLGQRLCARIRERGPMSFHDFMAACLYDAEHGYYVQAQSIGRGGDFITAPEISQTFGEMIGLWAIAAWLNIGRPERVRLIELGPGRGTLMADALRIFAIAPDFLAAVSVHMVETSKTLTAVQKQTLQAANCALHWHETLEDVPEGPSLVIANEFFDCLPVRSFIYRAASGWHERYVDLENDTFIYKDGAEGCAPADLGVPLPEDEEIEDGAILETHPGVAGLLQNLAYKAALSAALLIDYGYTGPCLGETVQAVQAHKFVDVFFEPGRSDLTSHVNFADLAHKAREAGFIAHGPMPMGEWLLRMGLEARVQQLLAQASPEAAQTITSGVARLVSPTQMGVLFQVLMLTHGDFLPPPPFAV